MFVVVKMRCFSLFSEFSIWCFDWGGLQALNEWKFKELLIHTIYNERATRLLGSSDEFEDSSLIALIRAKAMFVGAFLRWATSFECRPNRFSVQMLQYE
jgi:hypothetical protein